MNRILIIEDEEVIRKQLSKLLERNNYVVNGVSTIEEANASGPDSYDLILADIRLPGAPGTDILNSAQHAPVVIMTSHASVRSAVDSMKLGAVDYISKPFDHAELLLVIERSLRQNRLSVQNAAMRRDLRRVLPDVDFETRNSSVNTLKESFENLPENAVCIYLHGERGSGRELLARSIHDNSDRAGGPLVIADIPFYESHNLEALLFGNHTTATDVREIAPVNSSSFGLLREAHSGTLVLRNAIALPHAVQELLCDWIEDGLSLTWLKPLVTTTLVLDSLNSSTTINSGSHHCVSALKTLKPWLNTSWLNSHSAIANVPSCCHPMHCKPCSPITGQATLQSYAV